MKPTLNVSPPPKNIVKTGTFLYDNSVLCELCIAFNPIRWGTGDHEDEPEICEDVEIDTYCVFLGSSTGQYSGGSAYPSLSAAMSNIEARPGFEKSVKWPE